MDLFLPRPWSPLGRQNEHFAWLWRLARVSGCSQQAASMDNLEGLCEHWGWEIVDP